MTTQTIITILGTGTSQGVPVIGCDCTTCLSDDLRDKRLRSSVLISRGNANVVIDVGPDFRQQMLRCGAERLDAVLLTHEHNDHIIGMDDIRPFNFRHNMDMPVHGLPRVLNDIRKKFAYIFDSDPYPGSPKVVCQEIQPDQVLEIADVITVQSLPVMHGNLPVLGYRVGSFGYITDASFLSEKTVQALKGLDVLILNALRYRKHETHYNFDEAVEVAHRIGAGMTYLTHMSHELGRYVDLAEKLPPHIQPAYDGQRIVL